MSPAPIVASDVRRSVDRALLDFLRDRRRSLPDVVPLLDEIERITAAGGKRLRPAFCVWGYRAGGGQGENGIARAAAALELLHTFAIIHDDVMDRSPLRRGKAATYRYFATTDGVEGDPDRFGTSAAILVGDLAMALADELWWSAPFDVHAMARGGRVYHQMRAEVIGGQYLDLLAAARRTATPEETRRISILKSGRYTVERPLLIGAALAGAPLAVKEALAAYGAPLGEAFQLRDDVLGAFGEPEVTGKDADSDLREGKQTLLVALAREVGSPAERQTLERLGRDDLSAEEADRVRDVLRSTGALDRVNARIRALLDQSRSALASPALPREAAAALGDLADHSTMRAL